MRKLEKYTDDELKRLYGTSIALLHGDCSFDTDRSLLETFANESGETDMLYVHLAIVDECAYRFIHSK